ncbi:hypothetical protein QE394_001617 [Arthrobacter sp. SORGH_AS 212]|nr:hypothetical protein [Arthrobacter sp. SORGH_AS_0212]
MAATGLSHWKEGKAKAPPLLRGVVGLSLVYF